jgi:hypothetical protein
LPVVSCACEAIAINKMAMARMDDFILRM